MRVPVDDPEDAASVALFMERFGCRVAAYEARGLLVEFPNASSKADADAEAGLYLSMWRPGRRRPHVLSAQRHRRSGRI